jgi:rSAM/selenodomain-associated transferase 2
MIFADDVPVLVLFCKRPRLGVGKQRIARQLGAERALAVSELLLATALEDLAEWHGRVVIAPAAAGDTDWAQQLLPGAAAVPQGTGNLGQRINHVDSALRAAGARRILYIGIDAPDLNAGLLAAAADALHSHDSVLVPAEDGGVTLLGSARAWPALSTLPWETNELGAALEQCCRRVGWEVCNLGQGRDIDTWQDLRNALPVLRQDARPGRQALAAWIDKQQSIAAIIPVYNDLPALRRLLTLLAESQPAVTEVIVVDGAGQADCHQLCAHFGVRYAEARPCRGSQLDAGAQLATTELLWFLHADSTPPRNAVELIREHIAAHHAGGYFRFRFSGKRSWLKRLLAGAINTRARFGVPYGDQGLFMTRAAYRAAGGFAPTPLFEEVPLVKALRTQGRFAALEASMGVSPRRWERDGWLRRTLHNRLLALGHALGIAPERLARMYQPRPEPRSTSRPSAAG